MSVGKNKILKFVGLTIAAPFGLYAFWFVLTVAISVVLAVIAVMILGPWFLIKVDQNERLHQTPAYYKIGRTVLQFEGKGAPHISGRGQLYEEFWIMDAETGDVVERLFHNITVLRWNCCKEADQVKLPNLSRYAFVGILRDTTLAERGTPSRISFGLPEYDQVFDLANNSLHEDEDGFVGDLRVVSKRPIYFDHHVAITCGSYKQGALRINRVCFFKSLPPEASSDWPEIGLTVSLYFDKAGDPILPSGTALVDQPEAWPQFIADIEQYIRDARIDDEAWQTVKARAVSRATIQATD